MSQLPVVFFQYKSRRKMCDDFMRIEEYYENPELRGVVASQSEIIKWWKDKYDINYKQYWDGFNFPMTAVDQFIHANIGSLTKSEEYAVARLNDRSETAYIITGINNETLQHELHHALFYLYPKYKKDILGILSKVNTKSIEVALMNRMGYSQHTVKDEVAAYLIDGGSDIINECGIKIKKYQSLQLQLLRLYSSTIIKYVNIKTIEG